MKVAITIEGQRGLTWEHWKRFVPAVEGLGFSGLYRSDHFLDSDPPDQDSLELWTSLTWLACNTRRIEFGPLVTPVSFRHPVHTARMAKDVDDLSNGRLVLGVGAGWGGGQREHEMFGFDLLSLADRFVRFEEGLQVITKLLQQNTPQSLDGRFYQLKNATLLPRPKRRNGPPILIGGNGPKKVLHLAAQYADEWNAIYRTPEQFSMLNNRLNEFLEDFGRPRNSVVRSQMKGLIFGVDQTDLQKQLDGYTVSDFLDRGLIAGTPSQIIDQLCQLKEIGIQKVMLQWNDFSDISRLEEFSNSILHLL